MRTIDAPVVPIIFASIDPKPSKKTLNSGVPSFFMLILMPPDTTKSEPISDIKPKYSSPVAAILKGFFMTAI